MRSRRRRPIEDSRQASTRSFLPAVSSLSSQKTALTSPWNGTVEDLTPFATNQTLESANRFTLLDGKMAEAGSYLYFVAYGVEGESRLLFTPDPAQIAVAESDVLPDDTTSVAAETFEAELESAVVQAKCILCHVEGGLARNSSLQFQRTNTASALNNFASLSAYVDEKGAELLLSKITGARSPRGRHAAEPRQRGVSGVRAGARRDQRVE